MAASEDIPNPGEPEEADEFIPTRHSLLSRLKDWEDRESWRDFFETYWRLIYSVCLKSGLNAADAQDVVQETMVSVAKQMPGFQYDEAKSFKAWLLQITRRRIADHFRKHSPGLKVRMKGITTGIAEEFADPAAVPVNSLWEEEWQRNLMAVAVQRVKSKVKAKHFQIFDLSVMKEWPVKDIIRTLNVNRAQIYLAKHRVSHLIKDEVQRLEAKMNQPGPNRSIFENEELRES